MVGVAVIVDGLPLPSLGLGFLRSGQLEQGSPKETEIRRVRKK